MTSEKLNSFLNGAGFYIVLFLAIAVIGASGYFIFVPVSNNRNAQPSSGNQAVLSEQPEHLTPDPVTKEDASVSRPAAERQTVAVSGTVEVAAKPAEEPADTTVVLPLRGETVMPFSMDELVYSETMGDWRTHNGVDISCAPGDTVRAVADGTVEDVFEDSLLGTVMIISHADGVTSMYCGLAAEPAAAAGDAVEAGQAIGTAGNTNKTESQLACHIHLAMRQNDGYIDPQSLKFE